MLLYVASMTLASIAVLLCLVISMLCFTYPKRSEFLFNLAFLLFSDGMSSLSFLVWSLPKKSVCSCTLFLPIQNFLFLHSFACTMLIARRFRRAAGRCNVKAERGFWLYTLVLSFLFNLPVMFVNYRGLHDYPDISSTYQDPNIDNLDVCYFSSSKWAFLFNIGCLILPCLLALWYNVYCFKSGLHASQEAASSLVISREARNTQRYLGALVVVWVPIIAVNLLRYFSSMSSYTLINIIVLLTSFQGILHTTVYLMSYKPLRRYIKNTLCHPFCCSWANSNTLHEMLVPEEEEEEERLTPQSTYDIRTYKSPTRSAISGKGVPDDFMDRPCSAENFVKFGDVQYQDMPSEEDEDVEEAKDVFDDSEVLTPSMEARGWRRLIGHLSPPPLPHHHDIDSISESFSGSEKSLAELQKEEDQAQLTLYYHNLFHQAHDS